MRPVSHPLTIVPVAFISGPRQLNDLLLFTTSIPRRNLYLSLRSAGGGDVLLDANPRASYRATLAQAAIQHFGDVLSVHQGDRWGRRHGKLGKREGKVAGDPQHAGS